MAAINKAGNEQYRIIYTKRVTRLMFDSAIFLCLKCYLKFGT